MTTLIVVLSALVVALALRRFLKRHVDPNPSTRRIPAPADESGYAKHFPSRPEATIWGKVIGEVVDASTVRQRPLQDLSVIRISDVFAPGQVVIGFGVPNAFTAMPDEAGGYKKFSAKSVKRGPALVTDTKGILQSGIMVRLRDLPEGALERIASSMEAHANIKYWTCANACLRMLKAAGFEFANGTKSLDQVYMPHKTLSLLLRMGLSFEGQPVDFDIVRTTPDPLHHFTADIILAEAKSISRHAKRKFSKNKHQSGNTSDVVESTDVEVVNAAPLPDDVDYLDDIEVKISRVAYIGAPLRLLWGAHPLFEAEQQRVDPSKYLSETLKPFPQENPDFVARMKKHVLFNKLIIWGVRKLLAPSYTSIGRRSEADIHDMLRTESGQSSNIYNLVLTAGGETPGVLGSAIRQPRIIIARISSGLKLIDWILSKHVLMSGYDPTVIFAGEIWKDEDGVIHVNRNSGTYQPTEEELEFAVEYLRKIFPHLTFVIDDVQL